MRGGHNRKLPLIKALEGNRSKSPIEPVGVEASGEPFIAEHVCDDARGCIEVVKQSMPRSVYSSLDSFLLAAFGMSWVVHKRAALEVSAPGFQPVIANKRGVLTQNPWLKVLNQQAVILASLGDRLGLDPRSRAAIKLPNARQTRSKFEGLIGQAGLSLPSGKPQ